jgi:alginate biosynthesis protein Alg44
MSFLRQGVRVCFALGAGAALAAFVASRIYDRMFTHDQAGASYVATDTVILAAPVTGQVTYLNRAAKAGEPAITVLGDDGRQVSVDMPCDCTLMEPLVAVGSRVSGGTPAGELIGKNTPIYVTAAVDGDLLLTLYKNPRIAVTFPDGKTVQAAVMALPRMSGLGLAHGSGVNVKLVPDRKLMAAEIGEPVKVTFDTFPVFMREVKTAISAIRIDLWGAAEAAEVPEVLPRKS